MGVAVNDTGESLLSAVLAEPDSDDLRLILADWLQDNGEPEWGELMRLQVLQTKTLQPYQRIAELLPVASQRWLAPWALMGEWKGTRFEVREKDRLLLAVTFHRGLPEELWCPLQGWLDRSLELDMIGYPVVRNYIRILRLLPWDRMGREIAPYLHGLFADERINRLDTLDLSGLFVHLVHFVLADRMSRSAIGCFWSALAHHFRPWRGLREIVFPHDLSGLDSPFSHISRRYSAATWWR